MTVVKKGDIEEVFVDTDAAKEQEDSDVTKAQRGMYKRWSCLTRSNDIICLVLSQTIRVGLSI